MCDFEMIDEEHPRKHNSLKHEVNSDRCDLCEHGTVNKEELRNTWVQSTKIKGLCGERKWL